MLQEELKKLKAKLEDWEFFKTTFKVHQTFTNLYKDYNDAMFKFVLSKMKGLHPNLGYSNLHGRMEMWTTFEDGTKVSEKVIQFYLEDF